MSLLSRRCNRYHGGLEKTPSCLDVKFRIVHGLDEPDGLVAARPDRLGPGQPILPGGRRFVCRSCKKCSRWLSMGQCLHGFIIRVVDRGLVISRDWYCVSISTTGSVTKSAIKGRWIGVSSYGPRSLARQCLNVASLSAY